VELLLLDKGFSLITLLIDVLLFYFSELVPLLVLFVYLLLAVPVSFVFVALDHLRIVLPLCCLQPFLLMFLESDLVNPTLLFLRPLLLIFSAHLVLLLLVLGCHLLKLYALGFLDAFHGQTFRPVLLHLLVQILLLQVVLIFHGLCGIQLLFMVEQLVELRNL